MTAPVSLGSSTALATWNHADWRLQAECRDLDTTIFFPEPGTSGHDDSVLDAKSICAVCPVNSECLEFAIRTRQDDGVWGGATPEERRSMRRRRRRQALKTAQAA
jgi:WhiB family transcriptional regulator, redox-sensing transcriptional regulator